MILAIGLGPSLAMAEPAEDYWKRPGWYVGIAGLYGFETFEKEIKDELAPIGTASVKDSGGLNVSGGYRLNSWFAVDAAYEWMDNFKIKVSEGPERAYLDYATHSFTANAKFILPMWRVQPYLNLGIGAQYWDLGFPFDNSDTGWSFLGRPGAGIDFFVNRNWVLNVQVNGNLATNALGGGSNINNLYYVSLGGGLTYRF
jgi:hypothetical protein